MSNCLTHPLLWLGLVIRASLIILCEPQSVSVWYGPFLSNSVEGIHIDPWSNWLNEAGNPLAFPYGYVMWIMFIPASLLMDIFDLPIKWGYGITLAISDITTLVVLVNLFPLNYKTILSIYWLSPIILVAGYVLGFNDLVPVMFITLSFYLIKRLKFGWAGFFAIVAVSAKLSMAIILPIFVIYLLQSNFNVRKRMAFLVGASIAFLVFGVPFLLSKSAVEMLTNNPEMLNIYKLSFEIGDAYQIFLIPIVYICLLYVIWRIKRINYELFLSLTGLTFLIIVVLSPSSPGWYIWAMPLLVGYQISHDIYSIILSSLFSILIVIKSLFAANILIPFASSISPQLHYEFEFPIHTTNLLETSVVAIGLILGLRIWRDNISRNDYFRLSRKPVVIGIAGDSGSGKDTFADSLTSLFGKHSVASISGDNYHLWDRQGPMWKSVTPLNPRANRLEDLTSDIISLIDGKTIKSRLYDHFSGKTSRVTQIKSNNYIIASGLHTLYIKQIRDHCDIGIFLSMDEKLRQHLKVERDVRDRGHTREAVIESLEKRKEDSERFIISQSPRSDLKFTIYPIGKYTLQDDNSNDLRLGLLVNSKIGVDDRSLTRVLIGICGLNVEISNDALMGETNITIEGNITGEDIAASAAFLFPEFIDFLDSDPRWNYGTLGLMQLITLHYLNQILKERIL